MSSAPVDDEVSGNPGSAEAVGISPRLRGQVAGAYEGGRAPSTGRRTNGLRYLSSLRDADTGPGTWSCGLRSARAQDGRSNTPSVVAMLSTTGLRSTYFRGVGGPGVSMLEANRGSIVTREEAFQGHMTPRC